MNNKVSKFILLISCLLLFQGYYLGNAIGEDYAQIASVYSQNSSFSFKDDFAPPEASEYGVISPYLFSPPLSPFKLPQKPNVFKAFKFLIPPGVEQIILIINNGVFDCPDTESGQCNMFSLQINETDLDDYSFDTSTSATGILLQEDKADFWAGDINLRFGWNSDRATFYLDYPDNESDNYKLIKTSGVWCYIKTTSCVQQAFKVHMQMNLRDIEEYTAWYNLMTEKGAWDDDGNPVSDLSILDDSDTISNLEITNVDIPTTAVVNETVNCNIQISGGVAPYTYQVDFGDNVDDSTQSKESEDLSASFDHVYTTAASCIIEVNVTDAEGNKVTKSYEITIQDDFDVYSVDFNYGPDSSSDPYVYTFTPIFSDDLPETYTYQWDFGIEGTVPVEAATDTGEISYSFPSEGLYTVTLKAISSDGVTILAEKSRTIYIDGPELEITIVDDSNEDPSGKIYSLGDELTLNVSLENPESYTYSWSKYPSGNELGNTQSYTYQCNTPGRHIIRLIVTEIATQRQGTNYAVIYVGGFDNTFEQGFESGIEYCQDYPLLACGIAQILSNEGYSSGYNDGYQDALAYKGAQVSFADDILTSLDLSINNMRFPLEGNEYELSCILEYIPYYGDEIFWRLLYDSLTIVAEKSRTTYINESELNVTIVDGSNEDPSGKIYSLDDKLTLNVSLEDPTSYTYSWSEYPSGNELGTDQSYTYQCDTPGRHIIRVIVTEIATQRQGTDYAVILVDEFDDTFADGFESGIEYCQDYPLACGIAQIGSNKDYSSGYNDGYQDALIYKDSQVFFKDGLNLSINNMRFPLNGIEYELSCILEYMPYDGDEILWRLLIDDSFKLDLIK